MPPSSRARVVALYGRQLRARELSLDVLRRAAGPALHADPDLVAQALRNLVDNAVRYASKGTRVTVRIDRCTGGVAFAVENLGEEIAPDDLPHIFERFYRGEKSRSPDTGAGIGLALVQEIARAHGGEAGAESADGRTTVWFRLPSGHGVQESLAREDGATTAV